MTAESGPGRTRRVWRLRHFKVAEDADERADPRVMMEFFELGTFTSRELAEATVQRLVLQPGFRDSGDANCRSCRWGSIPFAL